MKRIWIIGIGMGNPETLTVGALNRIQASRALIGARRMIEALGEVKAKAYFAVSPDEILQWIKDHEDLDPISVLMSGDVGFFSGAKKLLKLIEEETNYKAELIPGISSLQYFCSRLGTSWEDVKTVSLHGRERNFIGEILNHKRTFFLTDSIQTPDYICARLVEAGLGETLVAAGERLSYEDERIVTGTAWELSQKTFDPLSVVLVENPRAGAAYPHPVTHGIPDDAFVRGEVPMTKEEVRSITLSKLRIEEEDILYDVGAGTGSVAVEMALQARRGAVFAIETKPEAVALIEKNKAVFHADNLHVIQGIAPQAMCSLPVADKAFIGGSRGNLKEIVTALLKKNPDIRMVVNAIALETMQETMETFKELGLEVELVQVFLSKAKKVAGYQMMMGQNPIFIISGQRKEAEQ